MGFISPWRFDSSQAHCESPAYAGLSWFIQVPRPGPTEAFVALEVERPDVAGVFSLHRGLRGRVPRSAPLLRLGRDPQALLAPDPLHPLAVDPPAAGEQAAVGTAVAPAPLRSARACCGGWRLSGRSGSPRKMSTGLRVMRAVDCATATGLDRSFRRMPASGHRG